MSFSILSFLVSALLRLGFLFIFIPIMFIVTNKMSNRDIAIANYIGLLVGIVFVVVGILTNSKCYDILDNKVEEGYVVYLDGNEIEPENVSFTQYDVVINDEDETIYLSQKKNKRKFYIPIFIQR